MKNHQKSIYYEGRYYYPRGNGYYYNSHLRKYLHQMVWITEKGPIPKGYEIHHIDFNRENNDISNLACIPSKEHHDLHSALLTDEERQWRRDNLDKNARPAASEWHKSEKGREWHSAHAKKMIENGTSAFTRYEELTCTMCGKKYMGVTKSTQPNHFCSNACKARHLRKVRREDMSDRRTCEICGKEFMCSKWSNTKTCSKSCAMVLRARKSKGTKPLI